MRKQKILEIGCGQGFNTYILSKNKLNTVTGIDLSTVDIKIARQRYPGIDFKKMNAERLVFKRDAFDVVIALQILEHVDNLDKVLDEIVRVLKFKGRLVASIPFYTSEKWLLRVRPTYFKEIHHVRIFKKNELERICQYKGLALVKKKRVGFLQHIELYLLFKRKINSNNQTSIGSWRDTFWTKTVHAIMLFFDPICLQTPLKYFPLWIIAIPFGFMINFAGNIFFPKSLDYEFIKK
ncbi:MAG TPA: class I SAM-dependent methyltransferase [Candidatus Levybacteria bacterium]|nr:class I SAM-dependent methyltransferase [Candidatus Levybacteria bacterium]